VIALFLACRTPIVVVEPVPTDYHAAAEAEALERVHDPARGGPPVHAASSPLPPFLGVDRGSAHYVGSQACAGCHLQSWQVWQTSAHSHAREVLDERRNDPGCLRCHTTGLGHPGGFPDGEGLDRVGCEACHGPGSDHLAAPSAGYGMLPGGPAACVACHTHDQAPTFRFDASWPVIAHPLNDGAR